MWLVGAFVACLALGQWLGTTLYIEPTCAEACAARGSSYASLWVGGRGRGESACVCADGGRMPVSIDWIFAASAAVGLGVVYGSAAWWARRPGRRRAPSSDPRG